MDKGTLYVVRLKKRVVYDAILNVLFSDDSLTDKELLEKGRYYVDSYWAEWFTSLDSTKLAQEGDYLRERGKQLRFTPELSKARVYKTTYAIKYFPEARKIPDCYEVVEISIKL